PTVIFGLFEPADALNHAKRICRKLEATGVPTALIAPSDPEFFEHIAETARAGTIPVVPFGPTEGASVDERFVHLGRLLSAVRTRKLLFLHRPGGLQQKGVLVPLVNLHTDYANLIASKELSRKERALVTQ